MRFYTGSLKITCNYIIQGENSIMIKVTVLGAWGTEDVGETSSFLVETDEFNIVLDMCPGVARQVKRADFSLKNINMAFGSHVHSDHILGATYLLFQHSVETRGMKKESYNPFTFIGDKCVLSTLDEVIKLHYPDRGFEYQKVECYDNGVIDTGKGVRICTAYNDHTVPTMAIRLEFEGKSICYTSDGLLNSSIYELANGVDLLIGEAFGSMSLYSDKYKKVKHTLGIGLGKLAKESGAKLLLPFHMNPIYETNQEKRRELLTEIREQYSGEILWPSDLKKIILN